ncbi:MAG: diguanylate cyclase [Betaproteobacteria bacterium]|uniref:Diguanylate cyclase n=1 Tax=Candidatus Proximibacter danicus TaxID=2954365 RepID=A0A9D7PSE5_9PROT|nr:diguanylate cyclase [Candidatus Proximibacter danicus]
MTIPPGHGVRARLANLAAVSQSLGRGATDELLRCFGKVLGNAATSLPEALAARLSSADFALLVPDMANPQAAAEHLLDTLAQEGAGFLPDQPSAWLGWPFCPGQRGGYHPGAGGCRTGGSGGRRA